MRKCQKNVIFTVVIIPRLFFTETPENPENPESPAYKKGAPNGAPFLYAAQESLSLAQNHVYDNHGVSGRTSLDEHIPRSRIRQFHSL